VIGLCPDREAHPGDPQSPGELLTSDHFSGYLRQPIPSPADEVVRQVVQSYLAAAPDSRAAVVSQLDEEASQVLNAFAQREATRAVRSSSLQPIRLGLVAVGMGLPGGDFRETQTALALLDHSARLLGSDLDALIEDISALLPPPAHRPFADFLRRDDRHSLLRPMGYAAQGAGSQFAYVRVSPWD
jgi:hypothetical protein